MPSESVCHGKAGAVQGHRMWLPTRSPLSRACSKTPEWEAVNEGMGSDVNSPRQTLDTKLKEVLERWHWEPSERTKDKGIWCPEGAGDPLRCRLVSHEKQVKGPSQLLSG